MQLFPSRCSLIFYHSTFSPHPRAFHLSGQPLSDKISEKNRRALSLLNFEYAVLCQKLRREFFCGLALAVSTQILMCVLIRRFSLYSSTVYPDVYHLNVA